MRNNQQNIFDKPPVPPMHLKDRTALLWLIVLTLIVALLQYWAGARSSVAGLRQSNWGALALGLAWCGFAFCIGWQKPIILVYAMAFFTFFTAWKPIDLTIGSLQASHLLAILAGALIVIGRPRRHWNASTQAKVHASVPLKVFLAIIALSVLHTGMLRVESYANLPILREGRSTPLIRGISGIVVLTIGVCAYFVSTRLIVTSSMLKMVIKSWIAGAIFTILVGLYLFVRYYMPVLPSLPVPLLGDNGAGIHMRDMAVLAGSQYNIARVSSFAHEPRHLTYLLASLLCFCLTYFLLKKTQKTRRWQAVFIIGVLVAGFAFTSSRSTYVLIFVIAGIVFWVARRRLFASAGSFIRFLALTALGAMLMLGVFVIVSRQNPLDFIRLQLESFIQADNRASGVPVAIDGALVAWRMFKSCPIWGWGWASYIYFTQAYQDLKFAFSPVPNNVYLLMLAETGIVGLLALLWLFWRSLRIAGVLFSSKKLKQHPLLRALGASLLVTYICFLFWDTIHYTYLWMLLGITQVAYTMSTKEPRIDAHSYSE